MIPWGLILLLFAATKLLSNTTAESHPEADENAGTHGVANLSSDLLEQTNISLYLHEINLNHLPNGFVKSEFLTHLTLEGNRIETISSSAFDFVPRLSHLSLANNFLQINLHQFSAIKSLKTLNLNGNCRATPCMVHLDAQFPSLSELYLENNNLRELPFVEVNLPLLNRLSLSNNELQIHDPAMSILREFMPSLSELYLKNCTLSKFDASQLLPTVTSLYLDWNIISCICNQYCELPSLKLTDARNLKTLSLSNNQISKIEPDSFNYTMNLAILDLSYNRILEIREGTFDTLHRLQFLRLEYNNLVKLNAAHTFKGLISLEHLSLGRNNISTIRHETFERMVTLKTLELNNNGISDIASGTFSKLASLKELSLAGNHLSRIADGRLPTPSSLTTLNLDSNEFRSTEYIFLDNSPNLVTLFLRDNPLTSFSFRWHSNAATNLTIILGNTCHTSEPSESMPIGNIDYETSTDYQTESWEEENYEPTPPNNRWEQFSS